MEQLNRIISYCLKYNLHLNLQFSLPGWWTQMNADYRYYGDLDIFYNEVHLKQEEKMYQMLSKRYASIPNSNLSFSPIFEPENYAADSFLYWNWNQFQTDDRVESGFIPVWGYKRYFVPDRICGAALYQDQIGAPMILNGDLIKGTKINSPISLHMLRVKK